MLIVVLHLLYLYTPTSSFASINSTQNRFVGATAMLYQLGQRIRLTTDLLLCYWRFAEFLILLSTGNQRSPNEEIIWVNGCRCLEWLQYFFSPEVVRGWNSKRDQCTDSERVESVVVLAWLSWLLVFVLLDILNLCVCFTFLADSAVTCNVIKKLMCVSGDRFLNVACVSPSSSHSSG